MPDFGVDPRLQTSNASTVATASLNSSLRIYEPGGPFIEELHTLRKKNRTLEKALARIQSDFARAARQEQEQHQHIADVMQKFERDSRQEFERVQERCNREMQELRSRHESICEARVQEALDRQLAELTGSVDERRAAQEQQQREERVEMLRRII